MADWKILDDPEDGGQEIPSQWKIVVDPTTAGKPRPAPPRPKQKVKKKPRQPVAPVQEFRAQLPPSIPEQIQASKFKFAPGPFRFRETEEQIRLVQSDPTKLAPQDRLRREQMMAAQEGRRLVSVRAETPREQEQSQTMDWLESLTPEQTTIYNIYQKGLGAIGDVSLSTVRGTAQSFSKFLGIPGEAVGEWIERAKKERDIDRPPIEASSIASGKVSGQGKGLGHLSRIGGSVVPLLAAGRLGARVGVPMTVTSGVVGALTGIGSTAEEVDHVGITKDRKDIALIMGGVSGATEAFGLERTLDKFGLGAPFRKAIIGVGMEGGQGGVQRFLDNVNAIYLGGWDPNRGVMDQVAMSALEETIGAAMIMGTSSIADARAKARLRERLGPPTASPTIPKPSGRPARIPPPPSYQPPMPPNRLGPLSDMAMMSKKEDKGKPLTGKEHKRRFDLKEIIDAYEAGETWVQNILKWMGGIDKVRAEYEALETRRMSEPPTPEGFGPPTAEELDEIFRKLEQAEPNALAPPAPPALTTPGGRRRLPSWSDSHVDSLSEEVYQAQIERHDAINQVQEAKASFPKDAYGGTKVGPATFHSLIIRAESIADNSPTPIEDIQKLAPNDPELTDSLLNYLLAYERMESARRNFDETMIGKPGRRVFGTYDHPDIAAMGTEEYELRYEEQQLKDKVENAAYAFYPMLRPFIGEYLGNHQEYLLKAYNRNQEPLALINKAIAENPFLDQVWERYVDARKRLEEGNFFNRIKNASFKERPPKPRPISEAPTDEELERRGQKELDELNKAIIIDKLGVINDRQNIIIEKMFEFFKQKEGDKFRELDSHNVILDIISNSENPLEDLKNLFPGDAKFARLAEMYLKNVGEQDELFSQLPPSANPKIPDMDAVRRYNENEKFVNEYRAGLNYDPRNVHEAEQGIREFERKHGKEYSIAKVRQGPGVRITGFEDKKGKTHPTIEEAKAANIDLEIDSLETSLNEIKAVGDKLKEQFKQEGYSKTLQIKLDRNLEAETNLVNKINKLEKDYYDIMQHLPSKIPISQRKKEEEHKKLSELAQDLDDQLWEKTPQNIKDMDISEHAMIPGRAAYDYYVANHPNLLQQRMEVYKELIAVYEKPQDRELAKRLPGWEKEINEGGLKPFKTDEAEVEAQIDSVLDEMKERAERDVDKMRETEDAFEPEQRVPERPRLPEATIDRLKDRLGEISQELYQYSGLYDWNLRDMLVQSEYTSDPAHFIKKAFKLDTHPNQPHFDEIVELADEYGAIIKTLHTQPPEKTNFEKEEERFLAPDRKKKEGETDYGIMYKPTGIEAWREKLRQIAEEKKKKEDPDAWADDIDPNLPKMSRRVPSDTPNIAADARTENPPPYKPSYGFGDPKTGFHGGYTPRSDDLAFDVMPALGADYGKAPYLRAPAWFFKAIDYNHAGGVNFHISKLGDLVTKVKARAPSEEHARVAISALNDLANQSRHEGLHSLSFLNLIESPQRRRGIIEHEITHAAQREGLNPTLAWIKAHPLINEVFHRREKPLLGIFSPTVGKNLYPNLSGDAAFEALADEMITYWIGGESEKIHMTEAEGRRFFKDYINHLRSRFGQGGIDLFKYITRLRQEVLDVIDESNLEWGQWNQRRKEQSLGAIIPPTESPDNLDVLAARGGKKTVWQKMLDAFSKKTREEMIENPPPPTIPVDEPVGTPPPRPPPPRDLRVEGPFGPLRKEHVTPEYTQLITRTFTKMLEQGGIQVDPTGGAPFHQVAAALREGKLQDVDIEGILQEEGIPWEQFAVEMEETASDAGKVLQAYSEIAKFWNEILDEFEGADLGLDFDVKLGKDTKGKKGKTTLGPSVDQGTALLRIVPIQFRVKRILRSVKSTALGKSLWQRAGNATQKAMLTQFSTFMVNSMTTTGQLPLRVVTGGMGAWMHEMSEGQGTFMNRLHEANEDMLESMRAACEVVVAMNPRQIVQWKRGQTSSTKFMEYQNIIHQLEKHFKDLHRKLFALGSGTETLRKGARELSIAQALAKRIPRNNPMREEILKDIDTYEKRLNYNTNGFMELFNKAEAVYDACLIPMQVSEYFFRRPMFVGQLNLELKREGIDLQYILATNQLDTIPPIIIEKAINKALEFTYAYMPGSKTGTDYALEHQLEKAAAWFIEGMNKYGGPAGALFGEPFAKAMFNGAKFVYEYSPLGGILPYARIGGNLGRKEKIRDFNAGRAAAGPGSKMTLKGIGLYTDPNSGAVKLKNETTHQDFDRLAKAMLGTMMYAVAGTLRYLYGGEEWWQFDMGEKDEKGNTVYTDVRRLKPMSTMFQLYDLVERIATGRMGDKQLHKELFEVYTGIRLHDNFMGGTIIESFADWYRNEPEPTWASGVRRGEEELGKAMAVYITPLLNVRDLFAQFMEEENVKKDIQGEGVLGPSLDRIPFLRRILPNLTSPVESSPIKLSFNPLLAQGTGYKEVTSKNFAGKEWGRMGLRNDSFISRLPDPVANREQNRAFEEMISDIGKSLETDPTYQAMDDAGKAFVWESIIGGDEGIASAARQIGWAHSPIEAAKRNIRQEVPGRFQRKFTGIEKEIEQLK